MAIAYYAESWPLWGLASYPVVAPPPPPTAAKTHGVDSHLRSTRVVKGYNVEATDGAIGEVTDFLISGRNWVLREMVVASGHGKEVQIPTEKISRISYNQSTVYVDSTKAPIMGAAQVAA
jgi:hypothetical protein